MQQTIELDPQKSLQPLPGTWAPGRFWAAFAALIVTLALLVVGFLFLRGDFNAPNSPTPQWITAIFAIVWGVGGVGVLFTVLNTLVEALPEVWRARIQPYIFVGPAIIFLSAFLLIPIVQTFYQSFFNSDSTKLVGLDNYAAIVTDQGMLESFRNNMIWLFLGTTSCVVLGLLVAVLADRSRFETLAKALIFMPMAISFVGAGVIWRFVYAYTPVGQEQIGLLNSIIVSLGGQPQAWTATQPWNNLFLILVLIWMQTGFAMVLFSAALKGVPTDLLEAARLDGANEVQTFFRVIIPYIQGTIITTTTTIAIFTLKIFDVVIVMTGGQYGTEVVATQFFRQFFNNQNYGYGSAIAIVLFIAVIPVMIYNLLQLRKQEGF